MTIQNKRLTGILITAAFILIIPLLAMQFTSEVKWTAFDFVVAAVLLFGTGLICELVLRKFKRPGTRIALIVTVLIILLLVWAELAVGIFGTPLAGH